jgi:uncharacterized membrane protein
MVEPLQSGDRTMRRPSFGLSAVLAVFWLASALFFAWMGYVWPALAFAALAGAGGVFAWDAWRNPREAAREQRRRRSQF